uniref:ABC transporter permease n=1 Tax=Lachnoclostridium phocaeense TaxID=1871021 RepID=UPI0026DC3B27|nr:ABC transporter permease [Lachnoclostridium phocaeense]
MNTFKKNRIKMTIISVISVFAFLGVWYLATAVLELVPAHSLPDPVTVFRTFITKMTSTVPEGATLPQHVWESFKIAMMGYFLGVIIGVPLGIAMGWFKWVDKLVRPIFDFLKPIPPIALIPVMIVIFGIGLKSKACIIFFSTVIPCVVNSYSGIKQTNQIHLWVSQTFGATRSQQLFTVALPSALPMIFAGLRVAMGVSWMALVAAELMGATRGVGYMIATARNLLRSDIIIVGLVTLGIIGICISLIFDFLEKKFVRGGM